MDDILKELIAIRGATLVEYPFVGYLLLKCEFTIDEKLDAPAANDGRKRIIVNPQLFKNLTKYDKIFTLAHEALHLALLTAERRQGRDPLLWNIATDCVINFLLTNANIRPSANLWKLIVTPETIEKITSVPAEQIQQMTADQIYNLLENYRSTIKLSAPALCSHDEYAGVGAGDEMDDLTDYWSSAVAEAQHYAKGIGKEPAGVDVFFRLLKPKINWRTLLRQAILQGPGLQVLTTWRRPHRKIPNDIPGYTRLKVANVWSLVDTSGSTVGEHLDQAMTEVFSIAKSLNAGVRMIAWDADAYEESFAKVKAKMGAHGGGGTQIMPALKLLLSRMRRNDIVVILSDGLISDIKDNEVQRMLAEVAAKAASAVFASTVVIPPLPPRWRSVLIA